MVIIQLCVAGCERVHAQDRIIDVTQAVPLAGLHTSVDSVMHQFRSIDR